MVTLNDVMQYLDQLKKNNEILDWKIVDEQGEKVILNVVHLLDDKRYMSKNYVLLVKNKGTANEKVYWSQEEVKSLKKVQSAIATVMSNVKASILNDLKAKYNMKIVENVVFNEDKGYVRVSGFVEVQSGQLQLKDYIIVIDPKSGAYQIYEVVNTAQ